MREIDGREGVCRTSVLGRHLHDSSGCKKLFLCCARNDNQSQRDNFIYLSFACYSAPFSSFLRHLRSIVAP
jgi:hypothetical protein